jgi:hypothetical protein
MGAKWPIELSPTTGTARDGGVIDLTCNLMGLGFVQVVRICLKWSKELK